MAVRTIETTVNEDDTKEEYTLHHRFAEVRIKNDTYVSLDDSDENSDSLSVPAGTIGWIVGYESKEKARIDFKIELGNGVTYLAKNKLALLSELEIIRDWGGFRVWMSIKEKQHREAYGMTED